MVYHNLLAVGYIFNYESNNKIDIDKANDNKPFFANGKNSKCNSAELLLALHSLNINFGLKYINMAYFTAFLGKYRVEAAFSSREKTFSLNGEAFFYLRGFTPKYYNSKENKDKSDKEKNHFIYSLLVVIILDEGRNSVIGTRDIINMLNHENDVFYRAQNKKGVNPEKQSIWKINGQPMKEFIEKTLQKYGLSNINSEEHYISPFLLTKEKPAENELYGIAQLEPGYANANPRIVQEVISKNASMIEGIDLFYSYENMTVIYHEDPVDRFTAITDVDLEDFKRDVCSEFKNECGCDEHSEINISLAIFLEYLFEIEPLRLEHFLLSVYEKKIELEEAKNKKRMAEIKSEITAMLNFYFVIREVVSKGVKRAMFIGEEEMGIKSLNSIFDRKLDLLTESIESEHSLSLERLSMYLTSAIAAVGVASVIAMILTTFFKGLGPLNTAVIVAVSSIFTLLFAVLMFSKSSKSK